MDSLSLLHCEAWGASLQIALVDFRTAFTHDARIPGMLANCVTLPFVNVHQELFLAGNQFSVGFTRRVICTILHFALPVRGGSPLTVPIFFNK